MKSKILSKRNIKLSISGALILSVLFYLFYVPAKEYNFTQRIEAEFSKTNEDFVQLSQVETSDWDKVCFLGHYLIYPQYYTYFYKEADVSIKEDFKRFTNLDSGVFKDYIWQMSSPFYAGGYFFIKDKSVIEAYLFNNLGIRYKKKKFRSYAANINVKSQATFLLHEIGFDAEACLPRDRAALQVRKDIKNQDNYLMLTETPQ